MKVFGQYVAALKKKDLKACLNSKAEGAKWRLIGRLFQRTEDTAEKVVTLVYVDLTSFKGKQSLQPGGSENMDRILRVEVTGSSDNLVKIHNHMHNNMHVIMHHKYADWAYE